MIADFFLYKICESIFKRVAQAGTINNGRFDCPICDPCYVVIAEEFTRKFCAKVAAAQSEGIYCAIHFFEKLSGFL